MHLRPLLIAAAFLAVAAPAHADTPEQFYKGRTITLVTPFGAGGTYDLYSRAIAQHMERHIPGKPNIVVQDMAGAGGIRASNYMFTVAPKDGSYIWMPPDTMVISQLLEPDKVKYKSEEFTWLGTSVVVNSVIAVRKDAPAKTLAELKTKEVVLGSTGKGSQTFYMPQLMNDLFGTKFKIVMGYKSSGDAMLAIERNEVQGISLAWGSWLSLRGEWVKSGYAVPLFQFGLRKEPDLPDVPLAIDLATTPEDKQICAFISSGSPIGRSLALPPGVPKDRIDALIAAFETTMKDPAFVADAKTRQMTLDPASAAEVQKAVTDIMKMSPETLKKARESILGEKQG
ncbi:MAG: Bug family tripartite tricarboxylate transporter substrate binding protein [Rhodospirillaceae bacterium]